MEYTHLLWLPSWPLVLVCRLLLSPGPSSGTQRYRDLGLLLEELLLGLWLCGTPPTPGKCCTPRVGLSPLHLPLRWRTLHAVSLRCWRYLSLASEQWARQQHCAQGRLRSVPALEGQCIPIWRDFSLHWLCTCRGSTELGTGKHLLSNRVVAMFLNTVLNVLSGDT
jgi:hypothetical protein